MLDTDYLNDMLKATLEIYMPCYALITIESFMKHKDLMIWLYPLPVILYLVGALILLMMWMICCDDSTKN